jgi:hypothetical protein
VPRDKGIPCGNEVIHVPYPWVQYKWVGYVYTHRYKVIPVPLHVT